MVPNDYFHGVRTREVATSVSTPIVAMSGVTFVVGTAPVHTVGGKVNEAILATSYKDAISALGYSDDWEKYTLCEVIYSHFKHFSVSPVVFVNVFDPAKQKTAVAAADLDVLDGKATLPFEAIASSVIVKTSGGAGEDYVQGTDYELTYTGGSLVLEILEGGGISESVTQLNIAYSKGTPESVTETDVIGELNVTTKKASGFELLDTVFPRFGIVPDILLAPGFSHNPAAAAVMGMKAEGINCVFSGKAYIDADPNVHYMDIPAWKKANGINFKTQILFYPLAKSLNRTFHLSTLAAALTAQVDHDNDNCPCEGPSNKPLNISGIIDAAGEEMAFDIQQAGFLNQNGVVTALNFGEGFNLWGNETACFPSNQDPKDYFIAVSRTFGWLANSVILASWKKVDKPLNRRLLDTIVDGFNIWLNGLAAEEKILGGRVEFREDENSLTGLMSGKAVFHIFVTPPSPARELEYIFEYDASYVLAALTA